MFSSLPPTFHALARTRAPRSPRCPCDRAALLRVPEEDLQQGLVLGHPRSLRSASVGDPEPQIRHPSPWGWLWAFGPSPASLTPEAGQPALTVPSSVPSSCTVGRDARGLPGEGEMSNTVVSSGQLPVRQKNCARVALQGRTTFYQVLGKLLAHTSLWWVIPAVFTSAGLSKPEEAPQRAARLAGPALAFAH